MEERGKRRKKKRAAGKEKGRYAAWMRGRIN